MRLIGCTVGITGLFLLILGGIMGYQRQEPSAAYLMLARNAAGRHYTVLPDGKIHRRFEAGVTAEIGWRSDDLRDLYIMVRRTLYHQRLNSSERHYLTNQMADMSLYSIVPDEQGRLLLVLRRNGLRHLYRLNPDGGSLENLTPDLVGQVMANSLYWQGDWLVFRACEDTGPCAFYHIRRDGTGLAQLQNSPAESIRPCAYSPSKLQLYCNESHENSTFYLLDHSTGAFTPLPLVTAAGGWNVIWAFDDEAVTYIDRAGQLVRQPLDDSPAQVLVKLPTPYETMAIFYERHIIYYKSFQNGHLAIHQVDTRQQTHRVIFEQEAVQDSLSYGALDEQTLLVGVSPFNGQHTYVYRVALDTGIITPFTQLPVVGRGVFFTVPDPRWIRFQVYDPLDDQMHYFTLQRDGQQVQPLALEQDTAYFDYSPLIDLPYQAGIPLAGGGLLMLLAFVLLRRQVA